MTPKEKAKQLVEKFYPQVQWKLGQEDCLDRAKQCALIAFDEMLNEYTGQCPKDSYEMERHLYWQKVKQEIEKL